MKYTNKWTKEILLSLNSLNGQGSLEEIYLGIEKQTNIDLSFYTDWKAQVRKNLYLHSSDCQIFKGTVGDQNDLFYSVQG